MGTERAATNDSNAGRSADGLSYRGSGGLARCGGPLAEAEQRGTLVRLPGDEPQLVVGCVPVRGERPEHRAAVQLVVAAVLRRPEGV